MYRKSDSSTKSLDRFIRYPSGITSPGLNLFRQELPNANENFLTHRFHNTQNERKPSENWQTTNTAYKILDAPGVINDFYIN